MPWIEPFFLSSSQLQLKIFWNVPFWRRPPFRLNDNDFISANEFVYLLFINRDNPCSFAGLVTHSKPQEITMDQQNGGSVRERNTRTQNWRQKVHRIKFFHFLRVNLLVVSFVRFCCFGRGKKPMFRSLIFQESSVLVYGINWKSRNKNVISYKLKQTFFSEYRLGLVWVFICHTKSLMKTNGIIWVAVVFRGESEKMTMKKKLKWLYLWVSTGTQLQM